MKKRILSILLALCMTALLMPMTVLATGKTYLALGDSISTGYGLANATTEAFPAIIKSQLGDRYTLVNKAVNGETTASLLSRLSTAEYQNAVAAADLITITIGGNDLMALLYQFLADEMNMTVEQMKASLESGSADMTMFTAVANAINNGSFVPTEAQISAIAVKFMAVISAIKALNVNATIIVTTQYDPYKHLTNQVNSLYEHLPLFAPDYIPLADAILNLSTTIKTALSTLNNMLYAGSGYLVADVYAAFDGSTRQLCHASLITERFMVTSVNLDFHPNASGHRMIASAISLVLPDEPSVTTYTVTFHYYDDITADTTKKTDENGKLAQLPNPTRTGYTFDGWYDAKTNGKRVTLEQIYTANVSLHAYWKPCDHAASTEKSTCETAARCSVCGDIMATLRHNVNSDWTKAELEHYHTCSLCTAKIDAAPHQYDNDCDTDCNVCHNVREVTHRYTELEHDDAHHWYVCEICAHELPSGKLPHSGGTATCTEQAICEKCGAAYGTTDENNHSYETTLTVDETTHYYTCSRCGAKKDETAHSADAQSPNGDGTHSGQCVCGKMFTENCQGGTATCTEKAICASCLHAYGEIAPDNHDFRDAWSTDEESHWHICSRCDQIDGKTPHEYKNDGLCVCGAEKDQSAVVIVIIMASVVLLGIIGVVVWWFLLKKKN